MPRIYVPSVDTQSAEYWHKRRQLERVIKSEEMNPPADKPRKRQNSRKKELHAATDDSAAQQPRQNSTRRDRSGNGGNTVAQGGAKKKERLRSNEDDHQTNVNRREGRTTNRNNNNNNDKPKSRSRSVRSDKEQLAANTKTEAELLEELRQEDDKPAMRQRDIARGELVSQHVPHYALPTKKLEARTDGRLSKLYVPKKPQYSSSEWPEDLDRGYCKLVVDTFKDMYSELIADPNWVYNQRKNYLNFLNTAEWQEMDLKLAKMSFQQLLQEEPLLRIHNT